MEKIQSLSKVQNNQDVIYRDYRTSISCKLFHPRWEQLFRVIGDIQYPNICARCEPDLFREEMRRFDQLTERKG